jgi:NADH-quinone oxidoreductase subunit N
MALAMFSLAGVPPLVGFYAKLAVLQSLLAPGLTGYLLLSVFAVLASLIGAFYYLRVVKVMYFDAPHAGLPTEIIARTDARAVLALNGGLLLVLGMAPGGLMTLCGDAIAALVKTLVT